jgi:hypothetical protein
VLFIIRHFHLPVVVRKSVTALFLSLTDWPVMGEMPTTESADDADIRYGDEFADAIPLPDRSAFESGSHSTRLVSDAEAPDEEREEGTQVRSTQRCDQGTSGTWDENEEETASQDSGPGGCRSDERHSENGVFDGDDESETMSTWSGQPKVKGSTETVRMILLTCVCIGITLVDTRTASLGGGPIANDLTAASPGA